MAFPIIPKEQLDRWRSFIHKQYRIESDEIYTFEGKFDLNFTIVTVPASYVLSLTSIRHHDDDITESESSAYVLSSEVLIKWFPAWRVILDGILQITSEGSMGIVQLSVDNAGLFSLFLGLAHECDVDFDCSPAVLANIAGYCKDHQLEALVGPRVENWIKVARYYSPMQTDSSEYANDWDWLVIGYEYGDKEIFHRASLRLAYWVAQPKLTRSFPDNVRVLPPGIRERILECRLRFLKYALRDLSRHYKRVSALLQVDNLPISDMCQAASEDCVHAQAEGVHRWLLRVGIMPSLPPSPTDGLPVLADSPTYDLFDGSPCDLFKDNEFITGRLCHECSSRGLLRRILFELENNIDNTLSSFLTLDPSHRPMTDQHIKYMADRKSILDSAPPVHGNT